MSGRKVEGGSIKSWATTIWYNLGIRKGEKGETVFTENETWEQQNHDHCLVDIQIPIEETAISE